MDKKKTTPTEHKKDFDETFDLNKDEEQIVEFRAVDAIILYPSLCNPAIAKKEEDGSATIELLVLSKNDDLQRGEAAFHLRYSSWGDDKDNKRDKPSAYRDDKIWKNYHKDKESVVVSKPYEIDEKTFGEGENSPDMQEDDGFTLKLGHLNIFPWVLEKSRYKGYKHVYKIAVTLKGISSESLYNIWWLTYSDYHELRNEADRWNLDQHVKDCFPRKLKKELKEYEKVEDKDNIKAYLYHPFYISKKEKLNIGHITDVHLDTRMDLYGQCVASVIEIKENCKLNLTDKGREIKNPEYCKQLKDEIANFNKLFIEISGKLLADGKADILVITGDLVDYNKGIHTEQTQTIKAKKPGEVWDDLKANFFSFDSKNNKEDRNWFLFYQYILQLYDKHKKPIYTILGNHDYCKHATAPWPMFGWVWKGVYDMNLTRYETALCYGAGFKKSKEFVFNLGTHVDCVKWYTYYINPFADFVVNYGDQTLFMVDWGKDGGPITPAIQGKGSLHTAVNLFGNGEYVSSTGPVPIKNYSIYSSWVEQDNKTKILFMHATGICPKDDISVGEVNFIYKWKDAELQYGSFEKRRKKILRDVEEGNLNVIVAGHSHRNLVMEVHKDHKNYAYVIGHGETIKTDFIEPEHLVMVSSSGGPLPKYLPGAPYICSCENKYNTGFFYEKNIVSKNKLFRYEEDISLPSLHSRESEVRQTKVGKNFFKGYIEDGICPAPACKMKAGDMKKKIAKRHRPGANLLCFKDDDDDEGKVKVKVETILSDIKPRLAVMCEENEFFTEPMVLEHIKNKEKYNDLKDTIPINIVSKEPFIYYGDMNFPTKVKYITYTNGQLPEAESEEQSDAKGQLPVENDVKLAESKRQSGKKIIRQKIMKDSFELLRQSAMNEELFAFMRYSFVGNNENWDREINITKDLSDYEQAMVMPSMSDPFAPGIGMPINPALLMDLHDPFQDMIIEFVTTPDFDKRKNVTGY